MTDNELLLGLFDLLDGVSKIANIHIKMVRYFGNSDLMLFF